jgi:hypothetical protein
MRRRKLLVALAGLAVTVTGGVVVLWPRGDRITRENCDRIQEGMSRAEVEAILGPPGDYLTAGPSNTTADLFDENGNVRTVRHDGTVICFWVGDRAIIYVPFDRNGKTTRSPTLWEAGTLPQPPLENLLWRLKRQWHRWFP